MTDSDSKLSGEAGLADAIASAETARQAGGNVVAALPQAKESVLLIGVAGVELAVPATAVERIDELLAPTWVPLCPPYILGLVNIGERVIAQVSLAALLQLEAAPARGPDGLLERRMLVTGASGFEAALVVDRISGLAEIPLPDIKPPSVFKGRPMERYLRGELVRGQASVGLLDLSAVLEGAAIR